MNRFWTRVTSACLAAALLLPVSAWTGRTGTANAAPSEIAGLLAGNVVSEASSHKPTPASAPAPVYANVSVHDPSIVKADDTFYVFGSHIEGAKSTDLMSWTRFTNGYTTPGNVIFGDLPANLATSFAWAGENDSDSKGGYAVWAPDVFWNKDFVNADGTKGAYLMYYCTSSTYIRSAIGIAASQSIEGPYTYVDTILYSGFTAGDAYDTNSVINKNWANTNIPALISKGTLAGAGNWFKSDGSYKNSAYPNAIDPNVFRDKDGKLRLAYGSWSGGIFVLELDAQTGRPIYPGQDGTTSDGRPVDRYFGTKIAGGYGKSGEGPYVVYDRTTDYYYLYMTYGGLSSTGGYNMRQFRSVSPEGPYLDIAGQSAVLPGSVSNEPYGNKLIGNYLFKREVGDPGTGSGVGYVSPGHNSVYIDPDTSRQFLVFHSRFPGEGESHEVRVHQMFRNKEGWPVVAPYRYSGEALEKIDEPDIPGEYKFINHGKTNTAAIQNSVFIRLNKDHTITGDVTGSWKRTGHYYAAITVDGVTYNGVFVRCWDPAQEQFVMSFTALSDGGVSVWGSRQPDRTDRQVVTDVLNGIDLGDTSHVVSDLTLPAEGTRHAAITWQTSDAAVITAEGIVTRPESPASAATATLTATVTKGSVTDTKDFVITVPPRQGATLKARYEFENNLTDTKGSFGAGTVTGNRINNTGGTMTYAAGQLGNAAVFDGSSGVRLPDGLIASDTYSVSMWVNPDQLSTYTTAFFGGMDENNWISLLPQGPVNSNTMLWAHSGSWFDATSGLTVATGEWSHLAFTVESGTVKLYVNGVLKFTGTGFPDVFTSGGGLFSLGVNWWDTPFKGKIDDLRIYDGILSQSDIGGMVYDPSVKVSTIKFGASEKVISSGSSYTPAYTVVPATAGNKTVVWSSGDATVAAVDPSTGKVTGISAGVTTITATAADGGGAQGSYTIRVVEGPVAYYTFDGTLADSVGSGTGTVTGNRITNTGGTITYGSGVSGQAAVFDGASGIRLPDGLISSNTYSVSLSVYLDKTDPYTTAFFGAMATDSWISMVPRGAGDSQQTMLWANAAYEASTGMQIPTGTWVDITFTVDNGTVTVYINGVAKFTGTGFPNIFTGDKAVFGLGVNYWDPPLAGRIDELKIYDRVLTAAEAAALVHPSK